MKRLYWYVFRGCLLSYLICLVSIVGLFVVVDLSTKLGDFMESGREDIALHVFRYYLYSIPLVFAKVSPLITVLAAIFVLARLKKNNELTPITASGVSLQSVLAPVVAFAAILSFGSLALEQWTIPRMTRILRERNLSEGKDKVQFHNLIRDPKNPVLFFMVRYVPSKRLMENVHISRLDERMGETEYIYATRGAFPAGGEGWVLEEGYVQRFDQGGRRLGHGAPDRFDRLVFDRTSILPFDVERGGDQGTVQPLTDLYRTWRSHPELTGVGVQFHFRAAFPFANLILLLVGLPFALRTRSHSYFLGAAQSAAVVAAYFALSYVCLRLGHGGYLPPIFSGWLPAVAFGSAGSVLFRIIPT